MKSGMEVRMKRSYVYERLRKEKIVAVVRAESMESGRKIIDAIIAGGIKFIEVTLTVDGAVDIIKELSGAYDDVIVGAGTVLDSETARMAILAGAKFIVSPCFSEDVMRLCNRYAVAVIPGIMTVKEAVEALEMGAEILKVFPGSAFDPSIIKAFKGPLPQADFMPTGGVSVENAADWIKAGAVAVGTGSNLTAGAKTGDYSLITREAAHFISAL